MKDGWTMCLRRDTDFSGQLGRELEFAGRLNNCDRDCD